MNAIVLTGCTPEPLLAYLKSLGMFRIVARQADDTARGFWQNGTFVLSTRMTEAELVDFWLNRYRPTPVIVPWSGSVFFEENYRLKKKTHPQSPSADQIIAAFLETTSDRLSSYRKAIRDALSTLAACGIREKKDMEDKEAKRRYIALLRSIADEDVVDWIDCCAILSEEKVTLNTLMGSGGGSDGRTHFSDNFMQNLWDVLPDFDPQRKKPNQSSRPLLDHALWGTNTFHLMPDRTSALYDAGAVGGANAGQGFERTSLTNPWNFILCLEGAMVFAGAVSRRHAAGERNRASFPFQVKLTTTSLDSSVERETSGNELWLPIWEKPATFDEMVAMLSEGRITVGLRQAENGVDAARAAAGLGVDRGIRIFHRYAIVKGRIGGENYHTSNLLGRFEVRERPEVHLLGEIDAWLNRFRSAASDDKAPNRYRSVLRRIDTAVFAFCQYGGVQRFADILCAFGHAEKVLAEGSTGRAENRPRPIAGLGSEWLEAANDGSIEFDIALALSGIYDAAYRIHPIRANLEPVTTSPDREAHLRASWMEDHRSVVWNAASLVRNLAAVLDRRILDGRRAGCNDLPIAYRRAASLESIAAFLEGKTDDRRIAELLWGMVLIDHRKGYPPIQRNTIEAPPLWRSYALLKLLFLPGPLPTGFGEVSVRPEAAILSLLRGHRPTEACRIAVHRLRASGFIPKSSKPGKTIDWSVPDPTRLAAALLIPVSDRDIQPLMSLVIRPAASTETLAA